MRRARSGAVLAALALACSTTTPGTDGGGQQPALSVEPASIQVENRYKLDVNVYAVRGGNVVRLGIVTAKSQAQYALSESVLAASTSLRFLVDPVGSAAAYLSDPVLVSPGDHIELRVGTVLEQSSISVW
jgi:hypothetical protein